MGQARTLVRTVQQLQGSATVLGTCETSSQRLFVIDQSRRLGNARHLRAVQSGEAVRRAGSLAAARPACERSAGLCATHQEYQSALVSEKLTQIT